MSSLQNLICKITADIKSAEIGISMLEGYLQGKGVLPGPLVVQELPTPSASFGENLRTLRKSRNLTQGELAEQCGATLSNVSGWECEKWQPDFETLAKLADYFGVSVDYLLGRCGK